MTGEVWRKHPEEEKKKVASELSRILKEEGSSANLSPQALYRLIEKELDVEEIRKRAIYPLFKSKID
ncbi:hypothetical protein ACFVAD_01140 [Sutcliffiella sp. NPDC057660]|uniref:hypothetical protein n=1 Tax=Sutcliffiella sp. NPDC057660 TaxID=3346199 RepID=UPI0036CF46C1